jgi:hypothetical protein
MAIAGGGKNSEDATGAAAGRRKPRRRTILNLGMPFVPVDDAVNQAEDAVAIGFDVLEKVVDEIKKGYKLAQEYNELQRQAVAAGEPRPPLPWLKVIERGKELQKVALEAMTKGNEILLDSTRSGMSAAMTFAETLANARTDVDEKLPRLAGPVFDSLAMKVAPGESSAKASWPIRNRGLARLRIHVKAEDLRYRGEPAAPPLYVKEVRFEPEGKEREISVLTVEIKPIPADQPAGMYEGSITAANFELFIGQLSVEVTKSGSSRVRPRKAHASRSTRR